MAESSAAGRLLKCRQMQGGIAEIVRVCMLQVECLQGLQPPRQALCEKSLGSVLATSSLPLASPPLLLAEMRRWDRRAQSYLQSWQQRCPKHWQGAPSLPLPVLHCYVLGSHARLLHPAPSPLRFYLASW